MKISWKSSNPQDSHRSKPAVYLSFCNSDYNQHFEKICQQLLNSCNCTVYYYKPSNDIKVDSEYQFNLSRMNLMVVLVSHELLFTSNRTIDFDIKYASEHNIPILPLVLEDGLDKYFNNTFGDIQYLKVDDNDITAIPYEEKLEKFLKKILVGNELDNKIRQEFCANIFLSYRKMDRAFAQQLISLVHEDESLREVAIWYDEFLIPGENFNEEIKKALKNSHLFLLAVTPNILISPNYVMDSEYPAAYSTLPILAAELIPTNQDSLRKHFPGLAETIDPYNEKVRTERIKTILKDHIKENNDPYHNYLIGMAYLSGIQVEKSEKYAVNLLTDAATQHVPEAAKQLANSYNYGNLVPKDYDKAKYWLLQYIKITEENLKKHKSETTVFDHYDSLLTTGEILEENKEYKNAVHYYITAIPYADDLCNQYNYSQKLLADNYLSIWRAYTSYDDYASALQYIKKATQIAQDIYDTNKTIKTRQFLADCYCDLADCYYRTEHIFESIDCLKHAASVFCVLIKARAEFKRVVNLLNVYDEISDRFAKLGDTKSSKIYTRKANSIMHQYKKLIKNADRASLVSISTFYTKRSHMQKSIRFIEMAINALSENSYNSSSYFDRRLLASYYSLLAIAWGIKNKKCKSIEYQTKAIEILQVLINETPENELLVDLSNLYSSLAINYDVTLSYPFGPEFALYSDSKFSQKQKLEANIAYKHYNKALSLLEQGYPDKTIAEYQKEKLLILTDIGRLAKVLDNKEEAIRCFEECLELCESLLDENFNDTYYEYYASSCYMYALLTRNYDMMQLAYEIWDEISQRQPQNTILVQKKKEAKRLLNL